MTEAGAAGGNRLAGALEVAVSQPESRRGADGTLSTSSSAVVAA